MQVRVDFRGWLVGSLLRLSLCGFFFSGLVVEVDRKLAKIGPLPLACSVLISFG